MVKYLVFWMVHEYNFLSTGKKWISVDARRWSIFSKLVIYDSFQTLVLHMIIVYLSMYVAITYDYCHSYHIMIIVGY